MVDFGGFDAIAHIDFPRRYLLRTHEPEKILEGIIKEIVRKKIVLELNSSPIRKGRAEPYPSKNIARLYVKHGGKKVTLGSDAHSRDEIGQDFDLLFDIVAEQGFQVVSFVKRKEDKI